MDEPQTVCEWGPLTVGLSCQMSLYLSPPRRVFVGWSCSCRASSPWRRSPTARHQSSRHHSPWYNGLNIPAGGSISKGTGTGLSVFNWLLAERNKRSVCGCDCRAETVAVYHSSGPQEPSIWQESVWGHPLQSRHRHLADGTSQSHWSSPHCALQQDSSSLPGPLEKDKKTGRGRCKRD